MAIFRSYLKVGYFLSRLEAAQRKTAFGKQNYITGLVADGLFRALSGTSVLVVPCDIDRRLLKCAELLQGASLVRALLCWLQGCEPVHLRIGPKMVNNYLGLKGQEMGTSLTFLLKSWPAQQSLRLAAASRCPAFSSLSVN